MSGHRTPYFALIAIEWRIIRQNSVGLLMIVLLVLAAVAERAADIAAESLPSICYIVYWKEDPWVEYLKQNRSSFRSTTTEIEIVPAEQLLMPPEQLLVYPNGAMSIQLRFEGQRDGIDQWRIWYWSRDSAEELNDVNEWFWDVTNRHFQTSPAFQVRYSTLQQLGPGQEDRLRPAFTEGEQKSLLVLASLLLPILYWMTISFAEQRLDGTLASLALCPTGWQGMLRVKCGLYVCMAVIATTLVGWILRIWSFDAPPSLLTWLLVPFAAITYVGLGLTIAISFRTVTATGMGVGGMLAVMTSAIALCHLFPDWAIGQWLRMVSLEECLVTSFETGRLTTGSLLVAIGWGLMGLILFRSAARRLATGEC